MMIVCAEICLLTAELGWSYLLISTLSFVVCIRFWRHVTINHLNGEHVGVWFWSSLSNIVNKVKNHHHRFATWTRAQVFLFHPNLMLNPTELKCVICPFFAYLMCSRSNLDFADIGTYPLCAKGRRSNSSPCVVDCPPDLLDSSMTRNLRRCSATVRR